VPNSIGQLNVFSGGTDIVNGRMVLAAIGSTSRGDRMLVLGMLSPKGDSLDMLSTVVTYDRIGNPVFSGEAYQVLERPAR
jgi:hypothetical protein